MKDRAADAAGEDAPAGFRSNPSSDAAEALKKLGYKPSALNDRIDFLVVRGEADELVKLGPRPSRR